MTAIARRTLDGMGHGGGQRAGVTGVVLYMGGDAAVVDRQESLESRCTHYTSALGSEKRMRGWRHLLHLSRIVTAALSIKSGCHSTTA